MGSGPCGSCDEHDDCSSLEGLKIARDRGLASPQRSGSTINGTFEDIARGWDGTSCPSPEQRQAIAELDGHPLYGDNVTAISPKQDGQCCYHVVPDCPGGRPFLVGGEPRVAEACGSVTATGDSAEQAALWLGEALTEHASIASFARLTLQLLALGAPADLVEGAQRAGLDELRHAAFCFEMASRFAGAELKPGPLSVDGALDDLSLAALIECNLREGCIGETLAARELERRAEQTTDPEVRQALLAICEDELRHAELAFQIHAWCATMAPDLAGRTVARILMEQPPRDQQTWQGVLHPLLSALAA